MVCLEKDFQTSSWILQAMKLLRFVGYHKVCEQRYSVTTMKVKNIAKNKMFSTIIIKNSSSSLEEMDINMVSKALG
jgi:hypothetical protein